MTSKDPKLSIVVDHYHQLHIAAIAAASPRSMDWLYFGIFVCYAYDRHHSEYMPKLEVNEADSSLCLPVGKS